MKNYIVGAIIIGLAVVLGAFIGNHYTRLGAIAGPEHYNREYFYGGMVQGGGIVIPTAGATTTLTAANVCENSLISWAPSVTSSTMTMPTSASIISLCLPKNGDFKDIMLLNSSAVSTHTITFTAGTNMTFYITGANKVIEYLNLVHLRLLRASSTAVYMTIGEATVQ